VHEAGPGPLLEQRKALLSRIVSAQKQGIGITTYMSEFNRIEGLVKDGQPAGAYQSRVASLSASLDDQLKRSQILKTQRPVAPQLRMSSQSAGHGNGSSAGTGLGSLGINPNDPRLEQLKQKYGSQINQIPGGLSGLGKLGPQDREKLLDSDIGKQLLKKYLGN
jgi:hypothetical protein